MSPSQPAPSPDAPLTPLMPWPFRTPTRLCRLWLALKEGQRLNFPLIGGWVGQALFQIGYTMSRGGSIGANDQRVIGLSRTGNGGYVKIGPERVGITAQPDGIVLWESIALPKFLSRAMSSFAGNARPVLTFSLKPRGPLGWNSVLSVRYEDVWMVKVPEAEAVQGSSGVYAAVSIQRVLIPVAIGLGMVIAAPYLVAGASKVVDFLKTGALKVIEFLKEIYTQPTPLNP